MTDPRSVPSPAAGGCRRAGRMLGAALLVLAFALGLGACGDDDEPPPSATAGPTAAATASTPSASTPTPTTTTADGIDPLTGASTEPVVVAATTTETALLSDVRAARHEGYDRIVFEFLNAIPGYDVRYVEPPVHQDGSGEVVEVQGDAILQIRMENALDADLSEPSAPRTYDGPTRLAPGTPEIVELARVGGFEGVLTWVAGLRDRVDFRVSTMTEPARLIIDVRNH